LVEFVCSQALAKNDWQFWQSFASPDIIYTATSSGIVEFLRICFRFFPDFVWTKAANEGYVAQIAIKNGHFKTLN
jgi:hypothetical protein